MTDEEQLKQLLDWEFPLRKMYLAMEDFYPQRDGMYDDELATLARLTHQECVQRMRRLRR